MKKEFPIIEVPASGKRDWYGGAWCLVWVYSTEGNFILKGFLSDCKKHIENEGWKCWAIFNLYHTKSFGRFWCPPKDNKGYRTIIYTFKCDFNISSPSFEKSKRTSFRNNCRFHIYSGDKKTIFLKRLPQVFINFNLEGVLPRQTSGNINLGSHPGFEGLRQKFNWE